ncbi:zinc-dependent alcohol dehydrogenase [Roseibium aquae]|uniref:zinc-dependent alcohol dehydrogenase n=2 Tax=Roseibium aquae TaxID=1323746 RepID=UPI001FCEE839|nr:zinc-binding alcohol dehydrogenase [Roseibium aquae]
MAVRTHASGISRGTERLVLLGQIPTSEMDRMKAPFQAGDFPFPVKYGYACVGTVATAQGILAGRRVFCLHPHQTSFVVPEHACHPVPDDVPSDRAVLAANMETALNALWDGKPSPADHICVVGGGVVGLLIAYLCAKIPGTRVTVADTDPGRAKLAQAFGCCFALPESCPPSQDLVFHASASAQGLDTALSAAGKEAAVVEVSWYGASTVPVALGGPFHSQRLKIVSSQVGTIPPDRRNRWSFDRRLSAALSLLNDPVLDLLISDRMSFEDLPDQLPAFLTEPQGGLAAVVEYPEPSARLPHPLELDV